jgi:hypothetical protein
MSVPDVDALLAELLAAPQVGVHGSNHLYDF